MRRNRRKASRNERTGNKGERLVLCKRKHANERENKFACGKKERLLKYGRLYKIEIYMKLGLVQGEMKLVQKNI